jgi:uncharacterized protein YndB with AHSA1/START domain
MTTDEPTKETRSIDLQVEIDARPEQVWEAISTGPGISAWFVPAQVDPHEGGKVTMDFGSMGQETAEVAGWDPPRRFVIGWDQSEEGGGWGSALELLVEARDGGSCVVRLIHSGFGTGAEFDDELHQTTTGWAGFLHNIKLFVEHFAPQPVAKIFSHGGWDGVQTEGWAGLTDALGLPLSSLVEGRRVATSPEAVAAGAPRMAGVVSRHEGATVTLLVDEPAAGYVIVAAEGPDGGVFMNLSAYLFGEGSAEAAERLGPEWEKWMTDHFPHPEAPEGGPKPSQS